MSNKKVNKTRNKKHKMRTNKNNKNALRHGGYARDVVMQWEDPEEFNTHVAQLTRTYEPGGDIGQQHIVLENAMHYLALNRLRRHAQISLRLTPLAQHIAASGKSTVPGISRVLLAQVENADLSAFVNKVIDHLERLTSSKGPSPALPIAVRHIRDLLPLDLEKTPASAVFKSIRAELADLQNGGLCKSERRQVRALQSDLQEFKRSCAVKAVQSAQENIEAFSVLTEKLQKRTDAILRAIKRNLETLVQLKEFARLYSTDKILRISDATPVKGHVIDARKASDLKIWGDDPPDDDNDEDNDDDENECDWEHEYDNDNNDVDWDVAEEK